MAAPIGNVNPDEGSRGGFAGSRRIGQRANLNTENLIRAILRLQDQPISPDDIRRLREARAKGHKKVPFLPKGPRVDPNDQVREVLRKVLENLAAGQRRIEQRGRAPVSDLARILRKEFKGNITSLDAPPRKPDAPKPLQGNLDLTASEGGLEGEGFKGKAPSAVGKEKSGIAKKIWDYLESGRLDVSEPRRRISSMEARKMQGYYTPGLEGIEEAPAASGITRGGRGDSPVWRYRIRPTKEVADPKVFSKNLLGVELNRPQLASVARVLDQTTHYDVLKAMANDKLPHWLRVALYRTAQKMAGRNKDFNKEFKRIDKMMRTELSTAKRNERIRAGKEQLPAREKLTQAAPEIRPQAGMYQQPSEVLKTGVAPGRKQMVDEIIADITRTTDKRMLQRSQKMSAKQQQRVREQLGAIGRASIADPHVRSLQGDVPAGHFGELPEDLDKAIGWVKRAMGVQDIPAAGTPEHEQFWARVAAVSQGDTELARKYLMQTELTPGDMKRAFAHFEAAPRGNKRKPFELKDRMFYDEDPTEVMMRQRRHAAKAASPGEETLRAAIIDLHNKWGTDRLKKLAGQREGVFSGLAEWRLQNPPTGGENTLAETKRLLEKLVEKMRLPKTRRLPKTGKMLPIIALLAGLGYFGGMNERSNAA